MPGVTCFCPGGHAPSGKHVAWLVTVENVPGAHAVHVRSLVELPSAETCWPGTQSVHGVQVLALTVVLAEPLAHAVHARSVVGLPSANTREPGRHAVHGSHAETAVLSWSQVPGAQGSFGVVPPGQNVPGSHGAHDARFSVEVEGAVPAGHESAGRQASWFGKSEAVPSAQGLQVWSELAVPFERT